MEVQWNSKSEKADFPVPFESSFSLVKHISHESEHEELMNSLNFLLAVSESSGRNLRTLEWAVPSETSEFCSVASLRRGLRAKRVKPGCGPTEASELASGGCLAAAWHNERCQAQAR